MFRPQQMHYKNTAIADMKIWCGYSGSLWFLCMFLSIRTS